MIREARTTHPSASLTHVRLLARMNSVMHSESRPLNELLAAARPVADVWPLSGMYPL